MQKRKSGDLLACRRKACKYGLPSSELCKIGHSCLLGQLCFCFVWREFMASELKEKDLTPREKMLIDNIRKLNYGTVTVSVANGSPIRIEQIRESIQLR